MCDTGNLIDLTGWDEPVKDETAVDETHSESIIIESTSFKGPYDPFDSMEKEACIKGLNLNDHVKKPEIVEDTTFEYSDQDLNNETPPVAMDLEPTNAERGLRNTSSTCQESLQHQTSLQKQVIHLNALRMSTITTPPPHTLTKFSRNALLTENLQMLAAESPIKLIEDEPPATSTSTSNLSDDTCSNTDFETRLKLLRIAMLDSHTKAQDTTTTNTIEESSTSTQRTAAKRSRASNVDEVEQLLQDLKSLIYEHVEPSKRKQFDMLIESISAALHCNSSSSSGNHLATGSPHAYTRQATFDLELEQQKQKSSVDGAEHLMGKKVQEFPDAMTCSSATYDGESHVSDKTVIPNIDTETTPVYTTPPQKPDSYVTEVVNDNLALQINELLERHNLTKLQIHDNEQCDSEHNETKSVGGATVILVVNSNAGNQLPSCVVHPTPTSRGSQQRTTATSNKSSTFRRRSSSLSIHDKSKQERPRSLVKQSSGDSSSNNTAANTTSSNQCVPLKELSVVGDKFNAMSSYRQRRNSFSVGLTAGKLTGSTSSALAQGRGLLSGRKTTTINETNIKTFSKDVIPVKRVSPMVKPSIVPTDTKNFNSTMPRCVGQETPMPSRSRTGSKLFCTSTPMPQMSRVTQQSSRSLKPGGNYTNSMPNVRSTSYAKKAAQ